MVRKTEQNFDPWMNCRVIFENLLSQYGTEGWESITYIRRPRVSVESLVYPCTSILVYLPTKRDCLPKGTRSTGIVTNPSHRTSFDGSDPRSFQYCRTGSQYPYWFQTLSSGRDNDSSQSFMVLMRSLLSCRVGYNWNITHKLSPNMSLRSLLITSEPK